MRGRKRNQFLIYLAAAAAIVILDFPIYWMVKTSLEPVEVVMSRDVSLGISAADFSSYMNVWNGTDYASQIQFRRYLVNSLVVVGASCLVSLLISILAGYSLSRFTYKRRDGIGQAILYVYMFPQMVLTIPLLILVIKLGLYNSLLSLVIVFCTFSLPYSIWMMKGYFSAIPKELEEAAMIDGCSRLSSIFRVVLPIAAPGLVATLTYSFILGWNNVIYPLSFVSYESKKLVSIGYLSLVSGDMTPWNAVMAASVLTSLPIVLLFLFLQRFLVQGLASGAVKS